MRYLLLGPPLIALLLVFSILTTPTLCHASTLAPDEVALVDTPSPAPTLLDACEPWPEAPAPEVLVARERAIREELLDLSRLEPAAQRRTHRRGTGQAPRPDH